MRNLEPLTTDEIIKLIKQRPDRDKILQDLLDSQDLDEFFLKQLQRRREANTKGWNHDR
jgi:hypothetical protein